MRATPSPILRQIAAAAILATAGPAFPQVDAYAASVFADAVAGPSARSYVVSESVLGGARRAAVWTIPQQGFPTQGATYAVVSPGDANLLSAADRTTTCADDPFGELDPTGVTMWLCGVGGFEVVLALPPTATALSFSYVYFTTEVNFDPADPLAYQDPFRVFLLARGEAPVRLVEEIVPLKEQSGLAFLEPHRVTVDVTAYAGRNIALQFLAANQWDFHAPSGALVDGIELGETAPPPPPPPPPPPVSTASIRIISPSDGSWVRGSTTFAAEATASSGVGGVTFTVDAPAWQPLDGASPAADGTWGLDVQTGAFADGAHVVSATVIGADGVAADALPITFFSDNTNPDLTLEGIDPGAVVRGTITVTAFAHDGPPEVASGIQRVAIQVNGVTVSRCVFSPPQSRAGCPATIDTSTLRPGEFRISASANDALGNASETSLSAVADNLRPAMFVTSPLPGQIVQRSVDVAVNVRDEHFAEVSCALDGADLFDVTVPVYAQTVPLAGAIDGAHQVSCLATDLAGNAGAEAVDFVVKRWLEVLHPTTLSLASKGGDRSVTAFVAGVGADVLLPLANAIALQVEGAGPVPATSASLADPGVGGVQVLMLKFDRQGLIDAASLAGATAKQPLRVGFTVSGREFGSTFIAVLPK